MCQKQCRDENGFKCHQTSESHLRQMQVFGLNPHRIIDGYTEEFEKSFLNLLAMRRARSPNPLPFLCALAREHGRNQPALSF